MATANVRGFDPNIKKQNQKTIKQLEKEVRISEIFSACGMMSACVCFYFSKPICAFVLCGGGCLGLYCAKNKLEERNLQKIHEEALKSDEVFRLKTSKTSLSRPNGLLEIINK